MNFVRPEFYRRNGGICLPRAIIMPPPEEASKSPFRKPGLGIKFIFVVVVVVVELSSCAMLLHHRLKKTKDK